jgi:hypothetical protein
MAIPFSMKPIAYAGLLVVPAAAAYLGTDGYFRLQAQDPRVWISHSTGATLAADWMRSRGPYDEVYITPDLWDPGLWDQPPHPTLRFLAPKTRFHYFEALGPPPPPSPDKSVAYFIGAPYAGIYRYLQSSYPEESFESISPQGREQIVYVADFRRRESMTTEPRARWRTQARFGELGSLVGVDMNVSAIGSAGCANAILGAARSGGDLKVQLYWRALGSSKGSYKISVQLLDSEGKLVAQHDGLPMRGRAPTTQWVAGRYVGDPHPISLPSTIQPGCYTLIVAMYDPVSNDRLIVNDNASAAVLGDVLVLPTTRVLAELPAELVQGTQ